MWLTEWLVQLHRLMAVSCLPSNALKNPAEHFQADRKLVNHRDFGA